IYPIKNDNDKIITFQFDIPKQDSQGQQFSQSSQKILNLSSASKDWGVRIARDNVIVQTKNYEGFEKFKSRIEGLIRVLADKFGIYHTSF
ncbi:TIGR04255 family protein, partial [Pantoea agglomerans]